MFLLLKSTQRKSLPRQYLNPSLSWFGAPPRSITKPTTKSSKNANTFNVELCGNQILERKIQNGAEGKCTHDDFDFSKDSDGHKRYKKAAGKED